MPPWSRVEKLFDYRVAQILNATQASRYRLYVTDPDTVNFRKNIAVTRPYKGHRPEYRPKHYHNLYAFFIHAEQANVAVGMEADDLLAMHATKYRDKTIICSRDKDLRQIPCQLYSWELGNQPSFGPVNISDPGDLIYERGKIKGTGYKWFAAQWIIGDNTDNVPGIPGAGPKAAWDVLSDLDEPEEIECAVWDLYKEAGFDEDYATEQAQLVWICRRMDEDGKPELWRPGLYY